ncbi:hypothetical protein D3C75_1016700 [compost metagenome]
MIEDSGFRKKSLHLLLIRHIQRISANLSVVADGSLGLLQLLPGAAGNDKLRALCVAIGIVY